MNKNDINVFNLSDEELKKLSSKINEELERRIFNNGCSEVGTDYSLKSNEILPSSIWFKKSDYNRDKL